MVVSRTMAMLALASAVAVLSCSGCFWGEEQDDGDEKGLGPREGLEAFILAQENADVLNLPDLVVEEHRESFKEIVESMSEDDLIATGLQFREEAYRVDETTEDMATFWSDRSKLFLVMMLEDGLWRVDPKRTDEMNADTPQ